MTMSSSTRLLPLCLQYLRVTRAAHDSIDFFSGPWKKKGAVVGACNGTVGFDGSNVCDM